MAAYHQCVVSVSAIRRYSSSSTRPLHSQSSLAGATYTLPDRMGGSGPQPDGAAYGRRGRRPAPVPPPRGGAMADVRGRPRRRGVGGVGAVAIGAVTLGGSPDIDNLTYAWLNGWDGAWYKTIARDGYSDLPNEFGQTTLAVLPPAPPAVARPVRPRRPVAGGLGRDLRRRLPRRAGRLVGAGRRVVQPTGRRAARCGRWPVPHVDHLRHGLPVGAVPGRVRCGRSCSSGDRRDLAAGLCAAVAVLARPNGFTVAIALVVAVWMRARDERPGRDHRTRLRAQPSSAWPAPPSASCGVWCALLWRWAGDPLAFLSAKAGWDEITIIEFLAEPSWSGTGPSGVAPRRHGRERHRRRRPGMAMAARRVAGPRAPVAAPAAVHRHRRLGPLRRRLLPGVPRRRAPAGPVATVGDHPRADGRRLRAGPVRLHRGALPIHARDAGDPRGHGDRSERVATATVTAAVASGSHLELGRVRRSALPRHRRARLHRVQPGSGAGRRPAPASTSSTPSCPSTAATAATSTGSTPSR